MQSTLSPKGARDEEYSSFGVVFKTVDPGTIPSPKGRGKKNFLFPVTCNL